MRPEKQSWIYHEFNTREDINEKVAYKLRYICVWKDSVENKNRKNHFAAWTRLETRTVYV